jgi:glycosyltransferase involved in cell wall biosynthesis
VESDASWQEKGRERLVHIGLNAQLLSLSASYRSAGISSYIYNLLRELPRAGGPYRYTAFTHEARWEPPAGMAAARTRWPTQRPAARIAWEQAVQPLAAAMRGVDLLHSLAYVLPLAWFGPTVVTILDLSFVLFPERFRPLNRLYLNLFTRLSARRADCVIAISENTKRDAVRLLGLDAGRVEVVYCGVDAAFRPQEPGAVVAFRARKGLPARFVLYVGTIEPRKNIIGLIDAYLVLKQRWDSALGELPKLVIAGAKGWYYEEVFAKVEQAGLESEVVFAGYVPAEDLPLWYSAADALVYPSWYEGFGLPVLEAMACGTPVVTSDRASLPEVVGAAGISLPPDQPERWALALWQLLSDEDRRRSLGADGRQRAAGFSWERTARETVAVYDRVLGRRKSGVDAVSSSRGLDYSAH